MHLISFHFIGLSMPLARKAGRCMRIHMRGLRNFVDASRLALLLQRADSGGGDGHCNDSDYGSDDSEDDSSDHGNEHN